MLRVILARLSQHHRTVKYPKEAPVLPDRFQGLPKLSSERCKGDSCGTCVEVCPTAAVEAQSGRIRIDLGRCLFCGECARACGTGAIEFTRDHRLSASRREDLVMGEEGMSLAGALDRKARSLFGRSLRLRQVSAAGCNACEADINVLSTVVFDLGRFGVQFVASPRHADGILVTGPVSQNMRLALEKTYTAVPPPKIVIALGACAISGGPYADHPETCNGCGSIVPVDLYVPGCPPHPYTILDGLLRLLGKIEGGR